MKLNLQELENKKMWTDKGYVLFDFDHEKIRENTAKRPEWVHFGAGNIFRIFPAALCQSLLNKSLMDTGIVCSDSYDFEIVDLLFKKHDCLTLGVTLKSDGCVEKEVIGSVMDAVKCSPEFTEDWKTLKDAFENPSLKMVSFTITEKGYSLQKADGSILPQFTEDFKNGPEKCSSFLCCLVSLLFCRFKASALPVSLVSMDNCSHNGEKLFNAVLKIAVEWEKNGFVGEDFIEYIKNPQKVGFPWTMIDKITPRPDDAVAKLLKEDGFEETSLIVTKKNTYCATFVNAEEMQYLVIEDCFPNGRPPLEKAGVYITDRQTVNKVEKMKVCTCLNPLHTALALSGCLLGFNKICDEMQDEDLLKMVKILGYREGLPVVVNPVILEPKKFIDDVIEKRLPNPFMPDTPQRIATDTSQKLAIRFGETVKALKEKNFSLKELKIIPLVYALWARYLMGIDDKGCKMDISPDPLLKDVQPLVENIKVGGENSGLREKLKSLLKIEKIFGYNVAETDIFEQTAAYFECMVRETGGVRKAVHSAVSDF